MEANNLGEKLGIYEEKVASFESQLENHNILVKQAQEQSKSIDGLTRVNGDLSGQIRTKDDQLLQAKDDYKKLEEAVSERSSDSGTLQLEINRLRSQVASQNEDNDDLKAQLLKQNIVRAKELAEQSSNSLAAEIETAERRPNGANSTEIIDKLTRDLTSCKSNNEQLRQYLDKILQSILEKDPSILEVK
jgi:chromosome segregation ATPase